mmetsp:Transcript_1707/g.3230  ORF Transcript_1707/g.3230 Transcript_1707/m.3230 type:complete len:121 (+) Transcript_1707:1975-2337(+)
MCCVRVREGVAREELPPVHETPVREVLFISGRRDEDFISTAAFMLGEGFEFFLLETRTDLLEDAFLEEKPTTLLMPCSAASRPMTSSLTETRNKPAHFRETKSADDVATVQIIMQTKPIN